MFNDFDEGDTVSVSYVSARSGNTVSRKGPVLQTPGDEKRGFFIQTGEGQLTAIISDHVYSLTMGEEDDKKTVQRKTYLGEFEGIEES